MEETETKEAPQPPEQDLHSQLDTEKANEGEVAARALIESYTIDESDDDDYDPSSGVSEDSASSGAVNESRPESEKGDKVDEPAQDLLSRAEGLGMSDDDIKSHSPEALEMTVRYLEEKAQVGKSSNEESSSGDEQDRDDEYQVDLDPDLYEPEVIDELERLNSFHHKRHERLQAQIDGMLDHFRSSVGDAFAVRFDSQIEGLGKDYSEIFGVGRGNQMSPSDPGYQNRQRLCEQMDILAQGYETAGKSVPEESDLFEEALSSAFRNDIEKIKTKSSRRRASRRGGQIISRPTQRRGSESSHPDDEAKEFISDFLSQNDLGDESMLPEDF